MSMLEKISRKIKPAAHDAIPLLNAWRKENKKIVFTNGCYDIIHRGHIDLLAKASESGDVLIVGLNSDKSVSRLKGSSRPLQDENSRALILSSFSFVDLVILFEEDTPLRLIEIVKPDVLVKGGDYKAEEIVGYDQVRKNGGEVRIIPYLEGYSTTLIIKKFQV